MTVLYIGDNKKLSEYYSNDLEVTIVTKHNGVEAVKELMDNHEINVIISDYNLPGNNGLYLYDSIKDNKALTQLPFILVLEEYNVSVFKTAFKNGISDCFVSNKTSIEQILQRANSLSKSRLFRPHTKSEETRDKQFKIPFVKRAFDIVIASIILAVLAPILLVIMLAIRLESKGKVYYIAKRVGRKTFDFYKLRSMRAGADKELQNLAKKKNQYNKEETLTTLKMNTSCPRCSKLPPGEFCSPLKYEGIDKICDFMFNKQRDIIKSKSSSFIKIVDDPRITKIGKFIRNTSIDELPQLINVIKGDMSLVGNRPLPVYEAELLTEDQLSKRFLAPAGITGLWQVELRGKGGEMSEEERIALDNKYADYFIDKKYTLWHDIRILLRTVPALLQKSTV